MRVLVTWGSKMGGTAGIGRTIAETLEGSGFDVRAVPADEVSHLETFDAVIVGGGLYGNRWPANVRRFVERNVEQLRRVPVWFFSSGPLDDSADKSDIPTPNGIAALGERIGVKGHVTFGGRLEPDAKGFPARAMAKDLSGDWRNPERIRAWATDLAGELPHAHAGQPIDHPARSAARVARWGLFGWALTLATMLALLLVASDTVAIVLHAIVAPIVFTVMARQYFLARGARNPLPVATAWALLVLSLDVLALVAMAQRGYDVAASIRAIGVPVALIFLATWATGALMSTMPWPKPDPQDRSARKRGRAEARSASRSSASPSSPKTAHRAT